MPSPALAVIAVAAWVVDQVLLVILLRAEPLLCRHNLCCNWSANPCLLQLCRLLLHTHPQYNTQHPRLLLPTHCGDSETKLLHAQVARVKPSAYCSTHSARLRRQHTAGQIRPEELHVNSERHKARGTAGEIKPEKQALPQQVSSAHHLHSRLSSGTVCQHHFPAGFWWWDRGCGKSTPPAKTSQSSFIQTQQ